MTAGVFKTVPADCIAVSEEDCRTLKATGRAGESKLHNLAVCSYACVFALIGAMYRKVSSWAWIGVHSCKRYEADLSGYHRAVLNARVARYLREMGIADGFLDIVLAVPYEWVRYLTPAEIVEFGIAGE